MLTVSVLLLVGAFILAVASAANKAPLWTAVVLLCLWGLLTVLPR